MNIKKKFFLKVLTTRKGNFGGTWVAQSVKHLTLDFGSGHDLTVRGIEPRVGLCADSAEPTWDPLPPPLARASSPLLPK